MVSLWSFWISAPGVSGDLGKETGNSLTFRHHSFPVSYHLPPQQVLVLEAGQAQA